MYRNRLDEGVSPIHLKQQGTKRGKRVTQEEEMAQSTNGRKPIVLNIIGITINWTSPNQLDSYEQ